MSAFLTLFGVLSLFGGVVLSATVNPLTGLLGGLLGAVLFFSFAKVIKLLQNISDNLDQLADKEPPADHELK